MRTTEHRLALASVLATLLASLTLVPLVEGGAWFVAVGLTVVAMTVTGVVARLVVRWWPVVVLLQVVAGLVVVVTLFARDVAVGGLLPGPATWGVFGDLVEAGFTATREETPPVPSGRGIIFLVTVGIALVALVVDLVAVSLRKPAVAGLPLLAVYCVPAAVLPGGLAWWWFALSAAGYLVLVGADGGDRIHAWGRVLGPAGDETGERALGGPLAGGRRLVAGCLLTAVVVPAMIPGLGEDLLGDRGNRPGEGRGGNITVINPILKIRDNLNQSQDVVVLHYRTNSETPEPLRIVSDDAFDGNQWSPSVGPIPRSNKVQDGLPGAPGLTPAVSISRLKTEITTLDLRQTYLPLPYPTTRVDIDGPWLFDSRTLNVVGDQVTTRNLQYTAQHLAVSPTVDQLQSAPAAPSALVEAYAKLPATTPREIRQTAVRVAGSGTAYEQAVALQQWFRNDGGFSYNTKVASPPGKDASSQDAVLAFLRNKQGYCVQFASSMAVMARSLGIPARVGVGFLPGEKLPDGRWEISIHDAHAWPELYFTGVGWVRFEPTPASRTGQLPQWALPPSEAEAEPSPSASATATQEAPEAAGGNQPEAADTPAEQGPPLWQRIIDAVPWRVVWIALLLLALGAVPFAVAAVVRWLRWRRVAGGPAGSGVEAAWDELRERLEDLDVRWAASWTPRALQLRLADEHGLGGTERAALGRLVADVEQVRYAPPGAPVRAVAELRADVDVVVQGVAASSTVSTWTRRRARWLPASGWRAVTGAARRVDVAADEAGRRVGGTLGESVRRLVSRR
jgi:transglutaminase-like putative cysteine protease